VQLQNYLGRAYRTRIVRKLVNCRRDSIAEVRRQPFAGRGATRKGRMIVEIAVVDLREHAAEDGREGADVHDHVVRAQRRRADLDPYRVGGTMQSLRRAEDRISEAVGNPAVTRHSDVGTEARPVRELSASPSWKWAQPTVAAAAARVQRLSMGT
jgi:hypothetical protein